MEQKQTRYLPTFVGHSSSRGDITTLTSVLACVQQFLPQVTSLPQGLTFTQRTYGVRFCQQRYVTLCLFFLFLTHTFHEAGAGSGVERQRALTRQPHRA